MKLLFYLLLVCVCFYSTNSIEEKIENALVSLKEATDSFTYFIQKFKKTYANDAEKTKRFGIFRETLERIRKLNLKSKHAIFGITKFSDLLPREFLKLYTGLKPSIGSRLFVNCLKLRDTDIYTDQAPNAFDWRDLNKVSRVKNQGKCGSCWAFSAVGNIESQYAIKYNEIVEFSEQQLVDCDLISNGCDGGLPSYAFKSILRRGGLQSGKDYPYKACNRFCKFDQYKVKAKLVGCKTYDLSNEDALKEVLYNNGPLSIAVDATSLRDYTGGILDECHLKRLNHAMLLVGYGTENGTPYWIVKNTWGTRFGENGYVRVLRGNNTCGILNDFVGTSVLA